MSRPAFRDQSLGARLLAGLVLLFHLLGAHTGGAAIFDVVYGTGYASPFHLYSLSQTDGTATNIYSNYPPGTAGSAAMAQRASDGMIFYIAGTAGNDSVYRWNPATPATAPVFLGNTGVPYLPRLAFAQDDVLYAINTAGTNLYTINQTTGAATSVATYTNPPNGGGDFTFAPDGTLYLVSGSNLYQMPLTSGPAINLGAITGATGSFVGMAYNTRGENVVINSTNPASLYTLNITTRVATLIGVAGAPGTAYGDLASAPGQYIRGKVFEDVNYAGGVGRSFAASGGVGRPNARVELYDASGNFIIFTTTDASGNYELSGAAGHSYFIRVVNSSVTSSRGGAGLVPVQTFRTDASSGTALPLTDRVGGFAPNLADAGNGSTTLAALNTATTTAQSVTTATTSTVIGGTISNVDFGFNFDTIVNANDSGQGSLRQFILNSNGMTGADTTIFMITDGAAHPGLRAGLVNQLTAGVARIVPTIILPTVTDSNTTIDGSTQTANIGNTNAVVLGTGGTVGVDNLPVGTVAGPEVEIRAGAVIQNGLVLQGSNPVVRGIAMLGFGAANGEAAIRLVTGATGALIENNVLGPTATSFSDPGAALRNYEGVDADGASGGTLRNNLLCFNARRGAMLQNSANSWTVTGNEIRDNGLSDPDGDGISLSASTTTITGNRIVGSSSQGIAITAVTGNVLTNNTFTGNGVGTTGSLIQSSGITLRSGTTSTTFDRNIIAANYGAGLAVNNGSTGIRLTRNSFYDNGTITARTGAGASGQIGVDLNSASDDQNLGTAPFVTLNDNGDTDTGGNDLLNFPVITTANIVGGNLVLSGFARPGSVIEFFVADGDPSGFGEGKTYLTTLTEGSVADTDPGTGTYNNPVNGLNQGTDTTNKFTFTIPVPGGVSAGTKLTATATLSSQTSEFSGGVTVASALSISGKVFEDVNYGGGAGRDLATSSGVVRQNATVELYNAAGVYVTNTTTDAAGLYTFTGLAAGNYTVRVVNNTVTSSRTGYVPGLLPVQTFRTNGLTGTVGTPDPNRVGGENPAVAGAGPGALGTIMDTSTGVFTAGISGQAQSITTVTVAGSSLTGIDFGFNFDTIVNVNDFGQGSLRQFITNANALSNAGLAQVGQIAGNEVSIFMISDGAAHAGLRAGLANQLNGSGVAVITLASLLPNVTDANTALDATTQTTNVGDTNAGTLGVGGTVGVDALALSTVNRPEVQLVDGAANLSVGLVINANNTTLRGFAIYGFGDLQFNSGHETIRVDGGSGILIEKNVIGASATSFTDPGAARSAGENLWVFGGTGTVRDNLIGYAGTSGMEIAAAVTGWTVQNNEFRGNSAASNFCENFITASGGNTVTRNLFADSRGSGIELINSTATNLIQNNTFTNNGLGNPANETAGMLVGGTGGLIEKNIFNANFGAGVLVKSTASGITISKNSIFANGTILNEAGAGPSGQIGIDLTSAGDNQSRGTAPFVTINDNNDADTGANTLLNFPILGAATISGGNLVLTGFARPGSVIEFFISAPDPSGFGEGNTYLVTLTEGSGADTDPGTGSYNNPVNGLNQGTDTTNKFRFVIPVPGGVALGTTLTATATDGSGNTSEFSGNVVVSAQTISGKVFEDVNYGGGAGRDLATSAGVVRQNAIVELYDNAGAYVANTTTDAAGLFTFTGLAAGNYTVRVVNSTVTSSRTGYVASLTPVQTFRTNGLTGSVGTPDPNRVGGEDPAAVDAGAGAPGTVINPVTGVFTAGISGQAQSITTIAVATGVTAIDFGFNFDTVVNVNDSGQGTLRQVFTNANTLGDDASLAQAGLVGARENVVFMISNGTAAPGLRASNNYFVAGVATIAPAATLPTVINPLVIDAQKQPGWTSAPIVELNGAGAGAGVTGITISAGSSVVRGLIVNRFLSSGITLTGAGGNTVAGNYLGTNAAGTAASQNDQQGLYINGSPNNIIGGTNASQRNVLSGNRLRGMLVSGAGATGNVISGNFVGLDASGTGAVANAIGIYLNGAPNNTIGGTGAGAGNVVSGNTQIGLYFVAAGSTGNVVQGNIVGLNSTASGPVPNGTQGIEFVTNASNNLIGGTAAGAPNIITSNGGDGVRVTTGTGNGILRNSISANTGLGINLGLDGVTPNDGAKNGAQPNSGMDTPVFTSAVLVGSILNVVGYVGSAPSQAAFAGAVVEIFKSDRDPSGSGEGPVYIGTLTADGSGNFSGSLSTASLSLADAITATATDGTNNTSEFAAYVNLAPGVSGTVYLDANHNSILDNGEAGTGLTLYAKIFPTSAPGGPALQAAAVNPATGAYTFSAVAPGSYTIIIDNNNTLADVAPTLPPGYAGTEQPNQTRSNVAVTPAPLPNQNFGLIHALPLSGRVFIDNGTGGGTPNDGILNGTEAGLAGVTVKLTDATGATTYDSATTDGAGNYVLFVPQTLPGGTSLKVVETNLTGYVSTGATIGNTAGTYDRATDTLTFALSLNTTYTAVNFGDVPDIVLTTDNTQSALPGSTIVYAHTFTAGSAGAVTFSTARISIPPNNNWSSVLYRDVNHNGAVDPGDTVINAPIAVATGETFQVLVQEVIPANAPLNARDTITLTASHAYANASPTLTTSAARTDITTVGNPVTAGLALAKSVDKATALPGEILTYTVVFTNNSSEALSNVVVHDSTPAFTTFVSATNGALPNDLTGVTIVKPAVGATGAIRWTFTGTLAPAGTSSVIFQVKVDQ